LPGEDIRGLLELAEQRVVPEREVVLCLRAAPGEALDGARDLVAIVTPRLPEEVLPPPVHRTSIIINLRASTPQKELRCCAER
jgi:hypothetical protein